MLNNINNPACIGSSVDHIVKFEIRDKGSSDSVGSTSQNESDSLCTVNNVLIDLASMFSYVMSGCGVFIIISNKLIEKMIDVLLPTMILN